MSNELPLGDESPTRDDGALPLIRGLIFGGVIFFVGLFVLVQIGRGYSDDPARIGRRPNNDEIRQLYTNWLYSVQENSIETAREFCWLSTPYRAERGNLINLPRSSEWRSASEKWTHMTRNPSIFIDRVTPHRDGWRVDVTVNTEIYPLPMRSQRVRGGIRGFSIGNCRPTPYREISRWYVAWDGDRLKFYRPLPHGLY